MSQAENPKDNQALLQSMLQRLKLQPGTPDIHVPTGGPHIHSETQDLQTVSNNPINGLTPGNNIQSEMTVNGKLQNSDSADGDASGHIQQLSPKSTHVASPVSSDGSFTRSKSENSDISQRQQTEQKQDENTSFVPKVYAWSSGNAETQNVFRATGQNAQTATDSQNTTSNRKLQSLKNKPRKWTQKIKERWRDRPGSFGKKERVAGNPNLENTPQFEPPSHVSSIEESVNTPTVDDRKDHLQLQTVNVYDESMRFSKDFDLGLGEISLLEDIASGQEWANFLKKASTASIQEGSSQEAVDRTSTNHYNGGESKMTSVWSEHDVGSTAYEAGTNGDASNTDIAMTQVSSDPLISMDTTEKTHSQSDLMDHGQNMSDMQISVREEQPQPQRSTKTELNNTVDNSSLRGRNSLGRKRQHQSHESIETKFQSVETNGNVTIDDGSVFLLDNHAPSSSSMTKPPALRGVLKSTLSCDSTYSVETVQKKRRVEETRHVRFSEEIIAIEPPDLGPDVSESEEESEKESEEDSFLEEDNEVQTEPALIRAVRQEQAAPGRRAALPGWIRALRRRNTGKKPR